MEHGNNWSIPVTNDNLNQTMHSTDLDDIMIRRMKNRERQRRYRARKRLEADTTNEITYSPLKRHEGNANNVQMLVPAAQDLYYASNDGMKASAEGQLVLARIDELPPVVEITPNVSTRVHCRRDWKRDARRANSNEQHNGYFSLERTSDAGSKIRSLSSVIQDDKPLENNAQSGLSISESGEMQKIGPGRRHWKAEARNRS